MNLLVNDGCGTFWAEFGDHKMLDKSITLTQFQLKFFITSRFGWNSRKNGSKIVRHKIILPGETETLFVLHIPPAKLIKSKQRNISHIP